MIKIKTFIKKDKEHKIINPTGAYGFIRSDGKLIMHLVNDLPQLPIEIETEYTTKGETKKETHKFDTKEKVDVKPGDEFKLVDRIIQETVILDPKIGILVAMWILKRIINESDYNVDIKDLKEQFDKIISKKTSEIKS